MHFMLAPCTLCMQLDHLHEGSVVHSRPLKSARTSRGENMTILCMLHGQVPHPLHSLLRVTLIVTSYIDCDNSAKRT